MKINEVLKNINKIENVTDIWEAIIIAWGDYKWKNRDEVIISERGSNHGLCYINHENSPQISFSFREDEDNYYSIVDAVLC